MLIFLGGLDDEALVVSVAVVDVADEQAARRWAGKIAVACGWPQEVRRFQSVAPAPPTSGIA